MSTRRSARCRGGWALATAIVLAGAARLRGDELPAIGLDEVRVGMRGHGLSVFSGIEPERFEVEVLGVLRNVGPDTSYIVARLSGKNLESTGVVAGMSGSPVYLDGKLAGAVAFSWPFSREAIAGITPIGAMRAIGRGRPPVGERSPGAALTFVESAPDWQDLVNAGMGVRGVRGAREASADLLERALDRLGRWSNGDGGRGLLWSVSGFGDAARERLARSLPNLLPLAGIGGAAAAPAFPGPSELVPGSSVAAVLVDGDLRLAATGTVTDRDGDRLLAFGHSIFGLAGFELPLATSEVITVFPSVYSSFKLASSGAIVGAFERDHPAGVAGTIGAEARMIPVRLGIAGHAERSYSLRVANLRPMLATLLGISCFGAWDATAGFAGSRSVDLALRLSIEGRDPLLLRQSFDGNGAAVGAVTYLMAVVDFLVQNDFAPLTLVAVEVEARLDSQPRAATLVAVRPDRSIAAPGERVALQVDLRTYDGIALRREETVTLPAELPDGRYTLLVGDGASVSAARLAASPSPPTTLDQVLELISSLRPANELAIVGLSPAGGLSSGGELRPRLPGSMRSIWATAGVRAAAAVKQAVLQVESRPSDRPLSGLVRIDLEIRRSAKGEK